MSVHDQLPNPSYLPPGFLHRLDVYGNDTAGFGFDSKQVARIFTRDLSLASWNRPLVITWVPRAGAVLAATENRAGTPVSLPNGDGVYHDGLWQLGVGPDQVDVPGGPIHWDRNDAHSITLAVSGGTVAIRASRVAGVEFEELRRTGGSVR
jgi:hypothetical protein